MRISSPRHWMLIGFFAGCFFTGSTIAYTDQYTPHHYKIVIIGAGVAGLEAARYLKDHGESDFIVLEARNRIGGRAWTVTPAGAWRNANVDLGAQWIHGASAANPLSKLVYQYHLATQLSDPDATTVYDANGDELADKQEGHYDALYAQFEKYLSHLQKQGLPNAGLSVSDAVISFISQYHLTRQEQHGLLYLVSSSIEQEYAADITRLSLLWYNADEAYQPPERVLTQGYQGVVNGLAADLHDHLQLNQVVTRINYQNPHGIVVTTKSGNQYNADYVICTLPIGVLQKKSVRFTPTLPLNKQITIDHHINMGISNKIVLLFPKKFWDDTQFVERVPNAYWSGKHWVDKGHWIEFVNMDYYIHQPILTAIVSGDFATHLEKKNDAETIDEVMQVLRDIYGEKVPHPIGHIITRWGQDPYAAGSFTSLRPGALADDNDYRIMAEPLADGHLLFAGEGTSAFYPGTIHGAYLTGKRAARYIVKGPRSFGHDETSADDYIAVNTLFLTSPIFANAAGEVSILFFSTMVNGIEANQNLYPMQINIGVTDKFTFSVDWEMYTLNMPLDPDLVKTRGTGDVGFSGQYLLDSFNLPYFQSALGLTVTFPTGDINKNLTDGFISYQPYFLLQQGIPQLANLQFFNEFALQFVQRIKSPHSTLEEDEEGELVEVPAELTPAAQSFVWNMGVYLPTQHFRYIAQINWVNNQWNHNGQVNQLFFTPGITYLPLPAFEMGLGVPIGLNHTTDHYWVMVFIGITI